MKKQITIKIVAIIIFIILSFVVYINFKADENNIDKEKEESTTYYSFEELFENNYNELTVSTEDIKEFLDTFILPGIDIVKLPTSTNEIDQKTEVLQYLNYSTDDDVYYCDEEEILETAKSMYKFKNYDLDSMNVKFDEVKEQYIIDSTYDLGIGGVFYTTNTETSLIISEIEGNKFILEYTIIHRFEDELNGPKPLEKKEYDIELLYADGLFIFESIEIK